MIKIITSLWPVLLPLMVYAVWFIFFRKKREADEPVPEWEKKLWLWTFLASALIALIYMVVFSMGTEENKTGKYTPAHYENGKLIPGKITDKETSRQ